MASVCDDSSFTPGALVVVECRAGPQYKGGNGGFARVKSVNEDGSLNVRYVMGGSEKSVALLHCSVEGQTQKREVIKAKVFIPEERTACADKEKMAKKNQSVKKARKIETGQDESVKKAGLASVAVMRDSTNIPRTGNCDFEFDQRKPGLSPVEEQAGFILCSQQEQQREHASEKPEQQPDPAYVLVTQAIQRFQSSGVDEFRIEALEAEVAVDRSVVEAALAALELENAVMYSEGVVYCI